MSGAKTAGADDGPESCSASKRGLSGALDALTELLVRPCEAWWAIGRREDRSVARPI